MTQALGLLLPVRDGKNGYFDQGFDIMTQMKSNLMNLLLTRRGERVMQPTFGSDIYSYIFEQMTDNTVANIKGSITSSVKTWMPFINLIDINVAQNTETQQIFIKITFSVSVSPTITDSITLQF
jgi:phage baseplate assembly protein W